jgi:DNA-binding transcriptional LysR family regulator
MNNPDLRHADFRRMDLNLLVVFDALMEERHVGKAAARVFIGQPAMSHALSRLREALGDDVFVRSGNRMEPTALALELAPKVRAWLKDANDFLFARGEFDLSRIVATFKIGTLGGIESALLLALLSVLKDTAPGVRIWGKVLERDGILAALDSEDVDIAVGPSELPYKEWHDKELIYTAPFECVYSPEQLELPEEVTLDELAALPHVSLSWRGDSMSEADRYFEAHGLQRNVMATASNQWAVIRILRQFPVISLQSALITSTYNEIPGIAVCPIAAPDFELSASVIWHRRNEKQPAQAYIRNVIKNILKKSTAR